MSRPGLVLSLFSVALLGLAPARAAASTSGDDIVVPRLRHHVAAKALAGQELADADGDSSAARSRHSRWRHERHHARHAKAHDDSSNDSALSELVPDLPASAVHGSAAPSQDDSNAGANADAAAAAMDLVSHRAPAKPVQPVQAASDNTASEPDIAMPSPPVVHKDSEGRVPVTSSDSDSSSDSGANVAMPQPQTPSDSGDATPDRSGDAAADSDAAARRPRASSDSGDAAPVPSSDGDSDSDSDGAAPQAASDPTGARPVSSSAVAASSDIVMPQVPARTQPALTLPALNASGEEIPPVARSREEPVGESIPSIPPQDLTGNPQPMRNLRMGLGFAMVAVMGANIATSQLDHEDHFLGEDSGQFSALHHGTEYATFGGLGALSLVELLSEDSHSVLHKVGFLTAIAATLAQAGLLYETDARVGYIDQINYSRAHLAAAWIGAAAMALSSISLAF